MMTREEAIVQIYGLKKYCEDMADSDESGSYVFDLDVQALDLALSALRPISRETVEKVWRGEWIPAESDFDDDDTLFDVDDWCDWQCSACHNEVCYGDPMERRWLPKFCPNCGAPMTDEAVDMVMERIHSMLEV